MTLKTILLSAASALVLSAGAASAAPATAESAVNVRSGPGTQYQVIGTIPGGATVDVGGCSANWCQVSFNGETGYASQSYLSVAEGRPAIVAPSYAYDDTPYYDDYYDDGYGYGAGVGLYVNPGHRFQHGWNGGTAAGTPATPAGTAAMRRTAAAAGRAVPAGTATPAATARMLAEG